MLVQAVFYQPDVQSAVVPRALSLDARDSSHPRSVRGPYKGNWPGAVRLHLDWTDAAPATSAPSLAVPTSLTANASSATG